MDPPSLPLPRRSGLLPSESSQNSRVECSSKYEQPVTSLLPHSQIWSLRLPADRPKQHRPTPAAYQRAHLGEFLHFRAEAPPVLGGRTTRSSHSSPQSVRCHILRQRWALELGASAYGAAIISLQRRKQVSDLRSQLEYGNM